VDVIRERRMFGPKGEKKEECLLPREQEKRNGLRSRKGTTCEHFSERRGKEGRSSNQKGKGRERRDSCTKRPEKASLLEGPYVRKRK